MRIAGERRNSQGEDGDQGTDLTRSGNCGGAGGNAAGAEGRRGGQGLRGRGNGVGPGRALQVRSSAPTVRAVGNTGCRVCDWGVLGSDRPSKEPAGDICARSTRSEKAPETQYIPHLYWFLRCCRPGSRGLRLDFLMAGASLPLLHGHLPLLGSGAGWGGLGTNREHLQGDPGCQKKCCPILWDWAWPVHVCSCV